MHITSKNTNQKNNREFRKELKILITSPVMCVKSRFSPIHSLSTSSVKLQMFRTSCDIFIPFSTAARPWHSSFLNVAAWWGQTRSPHSAKATRNSYQTCGTRTGRLSHFKSPGYKNSRRNGVGRVSVCPPHISDFGGWVIFLEQLVMMSKSISKKTKQRCCLLHYLWSRLCVVALQVVLCGANQFVPGDQSHKPHV